MFPDIDNIVHVYAPQGNELQTHLALIEQYNNRVQNSTCWYEELYSGADFIDKMLEERKGNLVVLAGNNRQKIDYISKSIDAGLNVLADKPMIINRNGFRKLKQAFVMAEKNDVLLYDIMTERYEITNILQKEFAQLDALFGELVEGSIEEPSITKESVHHFYKHVSGKPLVRPYWFFDVEQQGEGIVDVTTHLVDLVQWTSFPDQIIDYLKDIKLLSANRWPTVINCVQFEQITGLATIPEQLNKYLNSNDELVVFANGEINYILNGVHVKVLVEWNFRALDGAGDTHYSVMRGSRANLIIKQGKEQNYKPVLYVEACIYKRIANFEQTLNDAARQIAKQYQGISVTKESDGLYKINIPDNLVTSHEEHFAQVVNKYLSFIKAKKMPGWEIPNILAKYYVTTRALEMATTTNSY
ncbi:unnamed protein product [Didymodactylos carnosus]|uniref:Putative oxidoreductase C-terminal domain-containing protein n=1 Tax=Didymodactylos carnosus TaxID=1234261 RepID=A0A813YRL1_9BILA|nr:unnamed protein product [Didymodactylos carnosus]CAF0888150.1 unnamed protein product [Didymodactylos carnosus]CAF3608480.1 unnamed protein product [Didymodactylos carnosus]CAF3673001.1 unnamed protein product [Didymodactylos carnosus]